MSRIEVMNSAEQVEQCYPVIRQLRLNLSLDEYMSSVGRQQEAGYKLAALIDHGDIYTIAGFRILENLAFGRLFYVDDLVTDERFRSQGSGKQMMEWLKDYARAKNCSSFHLDSGSSRHAAHRFYMEHRMDITGFHFAVSI